MGGLVVGLVVGLVEPELWPLRLGYYPLSLGDLGRSRAQELQALVAELLHLWLGLGLGLGLGSGSVVSGKG